MKYYIAGLVSVLFIGTLSIQQPVTEVKEYKPISVKYDKLVLKTFKERKLAKAKYVKPKPPERTAIVGNKHDWLERSGINKKEWALVDYLVSKESGWNPNAVNKSSGACGLGQQLPCGKWSGKWNDPVQALVNMNAYVLGRYGSWANAVNHSKSVGWY